jgi:stage IV sporulation protein A
MDKTQIIKSLDKKSGGEIYLGVVGSVRTGKSTFIKKCIETLIVPNIENEQEKKKCIDEIPQSGSGKTIMTIEPKFVPSSGAHIDLNGLKTNIKLVDCVGFVTPNALGYEDELGNPRMVKTPWFPEEMPFVEAAELGTQKVIKDHATIGIVITTDGSFGELSRSDYTHTENKVISELKNINKPFIVIMNTINPNDSNTKTLVDGLKDKYDVPVIPMNIETMTESDIINILREALYEFPVDHIEFNIPDWIGALKIEHPLKQKFMTKMKESITNVDKLRDAENINVNILKDDEISNAYISSLDTDDSLVTITLEAKEELFNEVLKDLVGENISSKGDLIKLFQEYSSGRGEYEGIKDALKQVYKTGYGIVLPKVTDMKLEKPEVIKQGGRYGIKLQAKASSIHLVKVDVESSFEPIIGSELQSKELIDHLMKDESNPEKIWQSEIFGRSLDEIVSEGIQAKLSLLSEASKYKLSQTIQKMVNKGSSNLIAIVL